jgi:hypothetical protein
LETRIKKITAYIEGCLEGLVPGGPLRIEQFAESIGTRAVLAGILNNQALAVVSHDGKEIAAGLGVLGRPKRLQQAEGECRNTQELQQEAGPA